jgi:hypothetical protein
MSYKCGIIFQRVVSSRMLGQLAHTVTQSSTNVGCRAFSETWKARGKLKEDLK